ncbi:MAG: DUF4333 domain-containing protein [Solirubrobacterales bacterium]|nr:DUF4333 domain-containing protein [Solirubrobacterales bacterium]
MPRHLPSILAVPLLSGLILTGCGAGDTIDPNKTELAVRYDIEEATGEKVKSVTCPSDVPVSIGTRFVCQVEAVSGDEAVAELEITTEKGDLRMYSLTAP